MKKITNKIIVVLLAVFTLGCNDDPDNAIYDVFDGQSYGAIVRTLARTSQDFNQFDLNSTWDITIETQDEQYGDLLSELNLYANYTDNKADGVDNNRADALLATIPASAMGTSANGLPTTQLAYTFAETLSALGLGAGEYFGGDIVGFRTELVLTDGRTFSAADGSGSLQGSYFSSPYLYSAGILCIPETPFPGDYQLDMQDSYGDGWQGSGVIVTLDGVSTTYSVSDLYTDGLGGSRNDPPYLSNSVTITVPVGATSLTWAWVSGDYPSEATFQITTPSGATGFDGGPSPTDGPFALFLCDE